LNWGFWRRKPENDEPEIKNVRNVGDVAIHVSLGLSDTKEIKVSSWNQQMATELFWGIFDGLREREVE